MARPAYAVLEDEEAYVVSDELPAVFCWTKMGAEAGQPLEDIVRRKELERQAGGGTFAWGIGNSVGTAIKYAKSAEGITDLETLFTPMRGSAKAIDAQPQAVVIWRDYYASDGRVEPLPGHMLVTSRGHSEAGEAKRGHYALICCSQRSLLAQAGELALDHRAARNLVSANRVGASQVTSVVRYRSSEFSEAAYPVLFRARLVDAAFVRLASPVTLSGDLYNHYRTICASSNAQEWRVRLAALKAILPRPQLPPQQAITF